MSAYASVVLASACGALLASKSVSLRNKGRQNGLEQRSRWLRLSKIEALDLFAEQHRRLRFQPPSAALGRYMTGFDII
ncbi:hypothetical protein OPV22_025183 [Ensete ventricosum]|uniref:Uncharacterized protein n=1 Tax=Ensete ventricosum TaxID=4639 RepID=A0AAV8QGX6_ENSVE|nr:hypothetical protein OPV22_025183 [Ensete ventricosum]